MEQNKDKKVLSLQRRRQPSEAETQSWEEQYFHRLEEAALVAHAHTTNEMAKIVTELSLDSIAANPFQTREASSNDDLEELKHSIMNRGVIQPILVRELTDKTPDGKNYELIAGERRFRASVLAGLKSIPAIVEDFTDQESLEISIIENAQRENLNAIEEARAFQLLSERFGMNHSEIAKAVGKNRATVSNSLRLLQLPPEAIELLRSGELTAGHGRALLMVDDSGLQLQFARFALRKALSVRALEHLVSNYDADAFVPEEPDEDQLKLEQSYRRLEQKIATALGLEKVRLHADASGRKKLSLSFETEAAWKRFMSKVRE